MNKHTQHKCQEIIKIFMDDRLAELFTEPVTKQLHTEILEKYLQKIKHPMDLQTLQINLKNNKYKDQKEFLEDFRRIFENAILFYDDLDPAFVGLSKFLLKKLEKEYKAKFGKSASTQTIAELYSQFIQKLSEGLKYDSLPKLVDLFDLGKTFEESMLMQLQEKLSGLANKGNNNEELLELLGKEPGKDQNIELETLSKEETKKLWEYVKNKK